MGGSQSVRATHFQRPETNFADPMLEELPEDHHISISNKMVERLVEDATLATASLNTATSKADYKEKINIEKLKCMDDNHSERCGIMMEDLTALVTRIERRTANVVDSEPICMDCKTKVINCYNNYAQIDATKCWDAVGDFKRCVQEATAIKLRKRTQKDEKDYARKSRHMAHAREHALKDLDTHL